MEMGERVGIPQNSSRREILWIWGFAARLLLASLKEGKTLWLAAAPAAQNSSQHTSQSLNLNSLMPVSHWWNSGTDIDDVLQTAKLLHPTVDSI
ncbi:hypothetical protein H920_16038 [Fukomys damarensis]|uniref:Uncharacterized protein n=1 Tax=Fukomys damarensis TaxID=885580 RepID=A0A091CWL0_FUKDA|nr:hypothetical protein H920_16038 [Fukomys damarensis]